MILKTYTSERMKVVGEIDVNVRYKNQYTLVEQDKYLNTLLTKYADVFKNILENMTQHQAKMYIKAGTTSKFTKHTLFLLLFNSKLRRN